MVQVFGSYPTPTFHLVTKLIAVAAIAALSLGVATAAWAGSATAQSIWNSSQAMGRAH